MRTRTVFDAMLKARDEMQRAVSRRAETAFYLPATPGDAMFGILVAQDTYARLYQRRERQYARFRRYVEARL